MLGLVIRGRGQLGLERCTDILQGRERLEGYGDFIRGSYRLIPFYAPRGTAITDDQISTTN